MGSNTLLDTQQRDLPSERTVVTWAACTSWQGCGQPSYQNISFCMLHTGIDDCSQAREMTATPGIRPASSHGPGLQSRYSALQGQMQACNMDNHMVHHPGPPFVGGLQSIRHTTVLDTCSCDI